MILSGTQISVTHGTESEVLSVSRSWRSEEQDHSAWGPREHLAIGELWPCPGGWVKMVTAGDAGGGHPRQWDWIVLGKGHGGRKVQILRRELSDWLSSIQSAAWAGVGSRAWEHLNSVVEGVVSSLRKGQREWEQRKGPGAVILDSPSSFPFPLLHAKSGRFTP